MAAVRGEVTARLAAALDAMDPTDREVLALRHFEQFTSAEAAQVLGIQERAAAKRYLRALERLRAAHGPAQLPDTIRAFGIRGGTPEGLARFFMSHPPLEDRIARLQRQAGLAARD